jgi:hypothetical protein
MTHKLIKNENYLLVVDESEIKEGKTFLTKEGIIHTNIGWNYGDKVIIAHLPLNGSPILEGVPLLPPIKDDAEELAKEEINYDGMNFIITNYTRSGFIIGYNKAKEKFLLELEKQILDFTHDLKKTSSQHQRFEGALFGLNRLKYYLSQYPTEFECEMEDYCGSPFTTERCPKCIDSCDRAYERPKTITTAQGVQWVGKYK